MGLALLAAALIRRLYQRRKARAATIAA